MKTINDKANKTLASSWLMLLPIESNDISKIADYVVIAKDF